MKRKYENKNKSENKMFILGANSAGLFNKLESFHRNISLFKPGVFFVQETKARQKNKVKLNDYVIFEHIRNLSAGGGLLTAVHKSLKPVSVSNEDSEEILVVEGKLSNSKVRFINGYGPQENSPEEVRKPFFDRLDMEIKSAKIAGSLICIEMDSNSKLGSNIIPGDPKPQSENGKLLERVVVENDLIVVNATKRCEGTVTRHRKTINSTEEAVLDHFIVCKEMFKHVSKMVIDEEAAYSLTKYTNKKGDKTLVKESDHRTMILELDIHWNTDNVVKEERIEVFNYKNISDFETFKILTENSEELTNCFNDEEEDLEESSKRWLKILNQLIKRAFRKVRIKKNKIAPELELLFQQKESIKFKIAEKENEESFDEAAIFNEELVDVNKKIAHICAAKNKAIVDEYLGHRNDTFEGFSQAKTWNLMKKLSPKNTIDPPAAKKDDNGKLVTDREELETLYIETYKSRLQPNPISVDMVELKYLKEYLHDIQMKIAKNRISKSWTLEDLRKALKSLKNNKARDEHGHIYELFKYGGRALKSSLLKLYNLVKSKQKYPTIFQQSNISSFWKKKGEKSDLDNDRGVFNVTKIRSILDKMIYNDIYDIVDSNMSSSNIGARKHRNIRDHLFVINGIINDVINNKEANDIDVQIYDVAKCFDKLEFTNTANDLFNAGVQNDKFVIIANSNEKCNVAVKTPWGAKTKRTILNKIELQGTVLAGLKCSVSIDSIGKESLENTHQILYKYKNCTSIPPLSLIDDIIAVGNCSSDSVKVNATIQGKIQSKQLELSHKKCFKMHVGKDQKCCPTLSVHNNVMKTTSSERYLGDIISSDSKINRNISDRYNKGIGYANQILSTLKEISFGQYHFEQALQFRNAKLINGMLCSIESVYGLTSSHIDQLEQCDRFFMRKIFNCVSTTPTEAFYLETHTLPLRFVIIARRLMYYWNIVQKPATELVHQVFQTQKLCRVKNDWCVQVEDDLRYCGINLSENEIRLMSKNKFKSILSRHIYEVAREYLLSLKNKHTKSEGLDARGNIQDYLISSDLTTEEKQFLFHLRTRSYDCKANYKNLYKNQLACTLCGEEDSQQHLLLCTIATHGIDLKGVQYNDIFGSLTQQVKVAKVLMKISNKRKTMIQKISSNLGSQVHPRMPR